MLNGVSRFLVEITSHVENVVSEACISKPIILNLLRSFQNYALMSIMVGHYVKNVIRTPIVMELINMSYESFMQGLANDLTNEFVLVAPVDTGFLRNAIRCEVVGDTIEVWMPEYALFLEYGTGIFGPKGMPIVPVNAKALHWTDRSGEHFAKSVKGMHAQPFIRNTLYHKLQELVNRNAAIHLGREMGVNY